ncbi:VOC family protein [Microvirga thermotolerans]|uniref:Glyoxalase n=1 Tax=Microvirga thermotolerans TaxID=2651334 RepID=A0A5P9JY56_9HYPH|nr:VOC family protein [Microvirga thermotolerans]QFU16175.1 glyoxalase [Microvirga thermotolerans]
MILRLDHVQLAIPPGAEDACRRFYVDLLGMEEVEKPASLAARGGLWLRAGDAAVHLGVEADFRPARKAHPGFVVADPDALAAALAQAGHEPSWDDALPGIRRFYVADPCGNRLEFLSSGITPPA